MTETFDSEVEVAVYELISVVKALSKAKESPLRAASDQRERYNLAEHLHGCAVDATKNRIAVAACKYQPKFGDPVEVSGDDIADERTDKVANEQANLSYLLQVGLGSDGAHHKQWALYEAIKVVDPVFANVYEELGHDTGIEP